MSIADTLNEALMGQYLVYDKEQPKSITFICTSFMASCDTLKEILPYMVSYIEEALVEFFVRYNVIPQNTV